MGGPGVFGNDITQTELEGIAMALHIAGQRDYFVESDKWVLLQCDNIEALELLMLVRPNTPNNPHRRGLDVCFPRRQRQISPDRMERIQFIFHTLDKFGLRPQVRA